VEHHAEVLKDGVWHQRIPSWRDLVAVPFILGTVILLGTGARQMMAPFVAAHQPEISLSPAALPFYTLRTVTRMLAALGPGSAAGATSKLLLLLRAPLNRTTTALRRSSPQKENSNRAARASPRKASLRVIAIAVLVRMSLIALSSATSVLADGFQGEMVE
jgi:hypothetical protein